ncbi:unnamed protein product [Brassica oleracea var. botrytis]|uniref:(rape) hypothetical protein n=1 Tax=Brassica napus TaxID=3708 RepID=A0A816IBY3_BRANA|nr:unnamed protein product [Brassica napus]
MKRLKKSGALNLPQDLHNIHNPFKLLVTILNSIYFLQEGSVSINPFLSRSSWCFHVYKYVVLGSRAP